MLLLVCTVLLRAGAASFDQSDDFQNGATLGWEGNILGAVTNNPGGGPGGTTDAFLQTGVTGFHLGTKNTNQWAGDYLAAGVEAVELDLNHIEPETDRLNVRLLLFGPGGTFASRKVTPDVPANTWTHYVFGLTTNDLVHVTGGTGGLDDTLAGVTTLLIRHDRPTPTVPGRHPPHITATLGIDNIHAVPRRPEVGSLLLNGTQGSLSLTRLVAGVTYEVQGTPNLGPGSWTTLSVVTASSRTTNVTVILDGAPRFFRTRTP